MTRFARAGLTNDQIIELLGISKSSFYDYLKEYPEFSDSLKRGQGESIEKAKRTLFQQAVGFEYPEEKIFLHEGEPVRVQTLKFYKPDTTALIFYLINKAGGEFKDVRHIQASGGVDLNHKGTIPSALMEDLNKALVRMGEQPSAGASAPVFAEPRRDFRRPAAPPTTYPSPAPAPRPAPPPHPEPEAEDAEAQETDELTFAPQDYEVQRPSIPLDLSDLESE